MKRKMKKKLIAFMLCMVLVICNSVSILADTPAAATTTAENQVSETKTAKNEKSSEENKSTDDNDTSKQSEETDETKDEAPEATTTEKKEETTEATTEEKEDATTATTEAEEPTTEATTEDKATTEAVDETSESDKKKEATTTEEEKTTAAEEETANQDNEIEEITKYEYKGDDVNVTVTLTNPEDLPDDAELVVTPVTLSQEAEEKISEQSFEKKESIEDIFAYDIKFMQGENEVQPGSTVKVSISKPEIKTGQDATVYHVDDNNNLEDMNGQVDETGDVVFDTTHFSTYVIINEGDHTINVTVEHYDNSNRNNPQKIYEDDTFTLEVGDTVNNYAKATNWDVEKVVVNGNTLNTENQYEELKLTQNSTVKVYYTPKDTFLKGGTIFYDYTVKAGEIYEKYDYDSDVTYYSINQDSSYDSNDNRKRLISGTRNQNYAVYRDGKYEIDANNYTSGDNGIIRELVTGLDANGDVQFSFADPGFFDDTDEYVRVSGYERNSWGRLQEIRNQQRYLRKVYKDYKLNFSQQGDTYTLSSVENGDGGVVQNVSKDSQFFPLDAVKFDYEHAENGHNFYFGMRYDVEFTLGDYIGPLNYQFKGDDDLWVILDGKQVVIDLGGIHDDLEDSVDLWEVLEESGVIKGQLTDAQKEEKHTLTILYMERGAGESNCWMEFTLPSAEISEVTQVPKTNLTFTKQNTDGENLANARFELVNDATNATRTATSDAQGVVKFEGLVAGTYTLSEISTPSANYVLPKETWKVIVTTEGETTTAKLYQSDGETPVDNNIIINYTEIEAVERDVEANKTASVKDYDNRTYTINLSASSKAMSAEIEGGKVSVILVLDESGSMEGSISTLQEAAKAFVSELKKNSPDSEVAVISFDSSVYNRIGFTKLNTNSNIKRLNDAIDKLWADGGTRIGNALESANTLLDQAENTSTFVVAFSDGAPGQSYEDYPSDASDEATKAYTAANKIKAKGATIYTVGYGTDVNNYFHWDSKNNPTNNRTCAYHNGWNRRECYKGIQGSTFLGLLGEYSAADASNLKEIFENLAGEASKPLTVTAEYIEDTIDSRFELTEESRKALLALNVDGKQAVTITNNDDGTTTIRWNGVLINPKNGDTPGWSDSFDIKAKDNFMGGNMIPTNDPSSGVYIKLDEDSTTPTQLPFPEPSVNVKLLTPEIGNEEITIFKGDTIQPDGFLSEIAGTFNVKDFSNSGNLTANDNIPVLSEADMIKLKNGGTVTENYSYPDTNDVVGKFEFTYTKPANGDVNHPATKAGEAVETYTLTVKYIPDSVGTRSQKDILSNVNVPSSDGGTAVVEVDCSGNYKVNVVAGTIDITKELSLPDTEDKTFTFKVDYLTEMGSVDEEKSFTVTGTVENGKISTNIEDNRLTDLWRGTYRVTEAQTEGYSLISILCGDGTTCYSTTSENEIIFTIGSIKNSSGNEELVGGTDSTGKTIGLTENQINSRAGQIGEVTFQNERLSTININKQDRNNTPLEHARFKLEVKNADGEYEAVKDASGKEYIVETDNQGAAKFENLKSGDYRITEIQSPEGFSLLANPIEVILPYDVDVNNDSVDCTEGKTPVKYNGKTYYHDITYTIINNQLFTMPEAGGRNMFMMTLAGTAMIALAAGSTIYYRRRRGAHNKTRR